MVEVSIGILIGAFLSISSWTTDLFLGLRELLDESDEEHPSMPREVAGNVSARKLTNGSSRESSSPVSWDNVGRCESRNFSCKKHRNRKRQSRRSIPTEITTKKKGAKNLAHTSPNNSSPSILDLSDCQKKCMSPPLSFKAKDLPDGSGSSMSRAIFSLLSMDFISAILSMTPLSPVNNICISEQGSILKLR
jgi:hypothetical protein